MLCEKLKSYSKTIMPEYKKQLENLVRIPSISAREENRQDCYKVLEEVGELCKEIGMETKIVQTSGRPAFVATLKTNTAAPYVHCYNHMDVQPADEPQWKSSPFEPVVEEDRMIGRGTTDDKGPALSILHAIRFCKQNQVPLPNLQVIYETEEEIGSPNFGEFLDQNQGLLHKPESILVSDTIFEGDRPAITYKLKGMVRFEIELKTGEKDLHSGVFGNGVQNPVTILVNALSQCVNEHGVIQIQEILDEMEPISDLEMRELEKVAAQFDLNKFKKDCDNASLYTQDPKELLLRTWHKPTFELHGFEGAQWEPGVLKSAISYHVKAKVSMRLVPGMCPDSMEIILSKKLKEFHPGINVINLGGQKASLTPLDSKIFDTAVESCEFGFGSKPLFVGCGGTIGAIPQFQRVYPGAPVVLIAQSLMSDGYHAPNEEFRFVQAQRGIVTMSHYLNRLSGEAVFS